MKSKLTLTTLIVLFTTFSSCIKDEPENIEADILSFEFPEYTGLKVSPSKETNLILFEVTDTSQIDITSLRPEIKLSEGATVYPSPNEYQDFSDTVSYTVYSENKEWNRVYKVLINRTLPLTFPFEEWGTGGVGIMSYPKLMDDTWATANQGIALAKFGKVEEFPTDFTTDAYSGKYAARLKTQRGGNYFGFLIPIFSGSLFRGQFGPIVMSDFAKSVKFGQPHPFEKGRPVSFKGYYKYKVGDPFYDEKDNIIPGRIDECSIYAVFYKVTKGVIGTKNDEFLDGNNILTSDKIVAIAKLDDTSEKGEYTHFDLPFRYKETPDYTQYDYKLAVVFASSKEGDFYRGAVGSTLTVDEVEVVCQAYSSKEPQ